MYVVEKFNTELGFCKDIVGLPLLVGIILDPKLIWNQHHRQMISKCRQVLMTTPRTIAENSNETSRCNRKVLLQMETPMKRQQDESFLLLSIR